MSVGSSISGGGFGSSGSVPGDFVGPASSTDTELVAFDGTTGKAGKVSGVFGASGVLTVVRLALSAVTALFNPWGTTSSFPALKRQSETLQVVKADGSERASVRAARFYAHGTIDSGNARGIMMDPGGGGAVIHLVSNALVGWTSDSNNAENGKDLALGRPAAGILGLTDGSTGGAALELVEMTEPAAPAANKVRFLARDNGAGKTQIVAIFPSGAAQVIATEP